MIFLQSRTDSREKVIAYWKELNFLKNENKEVNEGGTREGCHGEAHVNISFKYSEKVCYNQNKEKTFVRICRKLPASKRCKESKYIRTKNSFNETIPPVYLRFMLNVEKYILPYCCEKKVLSRAVLYLSYEEACEGYVERQNNWVCRQNTELFSHKVARYKWVPCTSIAPFLSQSLRRNCKSLWIMCLVNNNGQGGFQRRNWSPKLFESCSHTEHWKGA